MSDKKVVVTVDLVAQNKISPALRDASREAQALARALPAAGMQGRAAALASPVQQARLAAVAARRQEAEIAPVQQPRAAEIGPVQQPERVRPASAPSGGLGARMGAIERPRSFEDQLAAETLETERRTMRQNLDRQIARPAIPLAPVSVARAGLADHLRAGLSSNAGRTAATGLAGLAGPQLGGVVGAFASLAPPLAAVTVGLSAMKFGMDEVQRNMLRMSISLGEQAERAQAMATARQDIGRGGMPTRQHLQDVLTQSPEGRQIMVQLTQAHTPGEQQQIIARALQSAEQRFQQLNRPGLATDHARLIQQLHNEQNNPAMHNTSFERAGILRAHGWSEAEIGRASGPWEAFSGRREPLEGRWSARQINQVAISGGPIAAATNAMTLVGELQRVQQNGIPNMNPLAPDRPAGVAAGQMIEVGDLHGLVQQQIAGGDQTSWQDQLIKACEGTQNILTRWDSSGGVPLREH